MTDFLDKVSFPYEELREGQELFVKKAYKTIQNKKSLLVSAPTGLGKTISALAPALAIAKKEGKTVIFLTSRQTQINQAIKTLKDISTKSKEDYSYVAFVGKRNMCVHEERDLHPAQDFNEFCRKTRERGKCSYFKNIKNEEYEDQIQGIIKQSSKSFMDVENFVELCGSCSLCPYEIAGLRAQQADLVICDYNYVFQKSIREGFLGRLQRSLEDCILIVDEAHNLPSRICGAHSYNLSTEGLHNALKELEEFIKSSKYDGYIKAILDLMQDIFFDKMIGEKTTTQVTKNEIINLLLSKFKKGTTFEDIIEELEKVELLVKEDRLISYVGRVAAFLKRFSELDEESFLRVLEKETKTNKTNFILKLLCIDPGNFSSNVLGISYANILMSATLTPPKMYQDILEIREAQILELESPFPQKNQLTLVDDEVTTKFTARSEGLYQDIATRLKHYLKSANQSNAIVFFPSYAFMDKILSKLSLPSLGRKVLREQRQLSKSQKEDIITQFRTTNPFNNKAKVLFAVTSGSFAEGLDLPGSALELVAVVGLPLAVPDEITQATIRHYDKKFGKGQLYAYVYPAMNKIIQAAGRCIRASEDKGVIILMDSRFLFPTYALSFPKHWHMKTLNDPFKAVDNFFGK